MASLGWRNSSNHIDLTLSSSDEDEQPRLPVKAAHRPHVERLAGSGAGRRLKRAPRIVDSEEEEEGQDSAKDSELERAIRLSLQKQSYLEEEDELDEGALRDSFIVRDDAASGHFEAEEGEPSTEEEPGTEDDEGKDLDDEDDVAPLDDLRQPAQPAVAMTVDEQLREYGFVMHQPGAQPKPALASFPKKAPFASVANTAASSSALFNKTAAARLRLPSTLDSFGFQSAMTERKVSAKERAFEQMREEQQRLGVPIDVPKNAHRPVKDADDAEPLAAIGSSRPQRILARMPADALLHPADDERALAAAMQDLDVNDNASAKDQESALKELVSSTIDMENVDTSSVRRDHVFMPRAETYNGRSRRDRLPASSAPSSRTRSRACTGSRTANRARSAAASSPTTWDSARLSSSVRSFTFCRRVRTRADGAAGVQSRFSSPTRPTGSSASPRRRSSSALSRS